MDATKRRMDGGIPWEPSSKGDAAPAGKGRLPTVLDDVVGTPRGRPIRVLIADDQLAIRAAIGLILEQHNFEVCAFVGDAGAAVAAAKRERPDVCLLEVRMPGSGIAAAAEITASLKGTVVVMLTSSRVDDDLLDALRAGASGYLLKDMDPNRLPLALQGVLAGEAALPRTMAARVLREFREHSKRRVFIEGSGVELTAREWDVLDIMRQGKSTEQIAERLFISPVTVRTHISSLVKKLNVRDRESAINLVETLPA